MNATPEDRRVQIQMLESDIARLEKRLAAAEQNAAGDTLPAADDHAETLPAADDHAETLRAQLAACRRSLAALQNDDASDG